MEKRLSGPLFRLALHKYDEEEIQVEDKKHA